MKVKELIAELQKYDPELDVLSSDFDKTYYDIGHLSIKIIHEGREVKENRTPCLCLIAH